ncbi:hypothetical protein HMSSN036_14050 [Paenibacillus macerans]|nr:hypothetical protein HMSSN036_14050 [Paenibacillus macerans]
MGDNWNGGNFSANGGAKYIWLPIEFGQGTDISIKWYSSWTPDILDHMGGVEAEVELPEVIETGTLLNLTTEIEVTPHGASASITTPVVWTVGGQPLGAGTFALPGVYSLQATLPELGGKTLQFSLYAVPKTRFIS